MTNDLMEVEFSIIGPLKSSSKHPLPFWSRWVRCSPESWELTLFSVSVPSVERYVISRIAKSLKYAARKGKEELSGLVSILEETHSGHGRGQGVPRRPFHRQFDASNQRFPQIDAPAVQARVPLISGFGTVSLTVMAVLLWFGGKLVLSGEGGLTGDWFIGYLVVFSQVVSPARSISDGWFRIQKGLRWMIGRDTGRYGRGQRRNC